MIPYPVLHVNNTGGFLCGIFRRRDVLRHSREALIIFVQFDSIKIDERPDTGGYEPAHTIRVFPIPYTPKVGKKWQDVLGKWPDSKDVVSIYYDNGIFTRSVFQ
jgi:hypothetical protein